MTGARRPPPGEQGLTLIEVLVTVAILGIAFVTVIGGMAVSIAGSDVQRKQATSQTVLRNVAEYVKAATYDCSGTYGTTLADFAAAVTEPSVRPVLASMPAEATYTVEFVLPDPSPYPAERWNGSAAADFDPIPTPSDCAGDTGLQRLTLRVRSSARPELCTTPPQVPSGPAGAPCEELQVLKRAA